MPNEFWREVVDRLSVDAPDTLLLAEAFWLMESYFVRTLGMHRVYNSAFMHMLRNEDNANYRKLIKNTLEFDPQILKRFVNFMNNPDEKTAVEQFGKGDKYFGICTIMATLPGLPMFGHGQIEGFAEKYGMEFKKAYWDEQNDENLIKRHESQVFPILHKRKIFSEVENFHFFDFVNPDSGVVEDVFAYSNYSDSQASLVVFHNKYAETKGWINNSDWEMENNIDSSKNISIFEALRLDKSADFVIYKDISSNLEFIRSINEIKSSGLFFYLHAYEMHVLVDFKGIKDDQWGSYRQLHAYLNGNGVPDIEEALKELLLQPVQQPLKEILNRGYFDFLIENRLDSIKNRVVPEISTEAIQKLDNLANGIATLTGNNAYREQVIGQIHKMLEFTLTLPVLETQFPNPNSKQYQNALDYFQKSIENTPNFWVITLSYMFLHHLGAFASPNSVNFQSQSWFSEWRVGKILHNLGLQYQLDNQDQVIFSRTIFTLIGLTGWFADLKNIGFQVWLKKLISNPEIQQYLQINRFQGVLWFNKERFESLAVWLFMVRIIEIGMDPKFSASKLFEETIKLNLYIQKIRKAIESSNYKVDDFLTELNDEGEKNQNQ